MLVEILLLWLDVDLLQCVLFEVRLDCDVGIKLCVVVFGVNDGLVLNLCLVMGVVGVSMVYLFIVFIGMVGLVFGVCLMVFGEWLLVINVCEMVSKCIVEEECLFRFCLNIEIQELIDIFIVKGLSEVFVWCVVL